MRLPLNDVNSVSSAEAARDQLQDTRQGRGHKRDDGEQSERHGSGDDGIPHPVYSAFSYGKPGNALHAILSVAVIALLERSLAEYFCPAGKRAC